MHSASFESKLIQKLFIFRVHCVASGGARCAGLCSLRKDAHPALKVSIWDSLPSELLRSPRRVNLNLIIFNRPTKSSIFKHIVLRNFLALGRHWTTLNVSRMQPKTKKQNTNALLRFSNLTTESRSWEERSPVYSSSDWNSLIFFLICEISACSVL